MRCCIAAERAQLHQAVPWGCMCLFQSAVRVCCCHCNMTEHNPACRLVTLKPVSHIHCVGQHTSRMSHAWAVLLPTLTTSAHGGSWCSPPQTGSRCGEHALADQLRMTPPNNCCTMMRQQKMHFFLQTDRQTFAPLHVRHPSTTVHTRPDDSAFMV